MAGTKTDGQRPAVGRSGTLAAAEGGLSCSHSSAVPQHLYVAVQLGGVLVFFFLFASFGW